MTKKPKKDTMLKVGPQAKPYPTKGGTHRKAIPDAVIRKLLKAGASPRMIVKKLGCDLEQVRRVAG